jgi:hypothetical protein
MTNADGTRWICDEDTSPTPAECATNGLQVIGGDGSSSTQLVGVKIGNTLRVGTQLVVPQPPETTPLVAGP